MIFPKSKKKEPFKNIVRLISYGEYQIKALFLKGLDKDMRKFNVLLIVIAFLFSVLQGCGGNDAGKDADTIADTENSAVVSTIEGSIENTTKSAESTAISETSVNSSDDSAYEGTDIGNGAQLLYKSSPKAELKLVSASGDTKVICSDMPSAPYVSPNGKSIIYLAPYEWEVLSDVHIYDVETGKDTVVLNQQSLKENWSVKEQNTPKKLAWLDDRYILMTIQLAYGTITKGGDLFVYDTEDKALRPLTKLPRLEQIVDVKVEKDSVQLDFVEFKDENMTESTETKRVITRENIMRAIRYKALTEDYQLAQDSEGANTLYKELEKVKFDDKKPFKKQIIDINGDGKKDEIKYQISGEYSDTFILSVNGLVIKEFTESPDENLYIVDIDKNDGKKEIAIQEFGPSDDNITYFYYYTGTELRFMGRLGGLCTEAGHIDGNGTVVAEERQRMLQTWFCNKSYSLDKEHLLEGVHSEFYPVSYKIEPVKLKTKLLLYTTPKGGTAVELKAGDTLKLLGSDSIEWCIAETSSGKKGWFAVDGTIVRENGLEASEVFEGLCFAD